MPILIAAKTKQDNEINKVFLIKFGNTLKYNLFASSNVLNSKEHFNHQKIFVTLIRDKRITKNMDFFMSK